MTQAPGPPPVLSPDDRDRRPGRTLAAWAAGLLLAGVSAVVGCRIADVDGVTPVPQLLAFLPWLLAPTGVALLLTALARRRLGMVWGVAVLGALAWYIEPYGKNPKDAAASGPPVAEVRVLSSNVQFGRGTESLVAAVRRERPGLVFVEECDYGCQDTLRRELPRADFPYRQAVEAGGSQGSVILSRYPLKAAAGVPGTMGMPGAVADVKGHDVRVQLAHPMPPLPRQVGLWRSELGALRDFAAAGRSQPTILAGDFNATQDHAAFRRILDAGLHDSAGLTGKSRAPSWPSRLRPPLGTQIDHVLVSEEFSPLTARFVELADTDHRALLVDLTMYRPAPS
ncbi:endonuclease/exonuclease/phosphatase family protein [Streptomyces sp. NPDC001939]|uniref:endonuclease/exonuclease/phosphatase family protein n=1 Tax=Streptomyces TaxID=1883 RepID=UPI001D09A53B|nr:MULTISPECIES: endonuclease/exonuclease/phosphatase family protein [Streptomyces]MCX5082942.1 endonuclease/exonuclease/phosphatase family protein [Streptomyces sp. NBC_00401]UDM01066.1 endonuclease/exonuclease/phosphatase family protein [Streptomyces longhuiensis]